MTVTHRAADAYDLFRKKKKIEGYEKTVRELIDDDTRSGELFKKGVDAFVDLASKILGTALSKNPYFKYFKMHIEALSQALNAAHNFDVAEESLSRAIRSADASAAIANTCATYRQRQNVLKASYLLISGSLSLLRARPNDRTADRDIASAGNTPETLKATVDDYIYEWRANYCELYLDAVALFLMAEAELHFAEAAMRRFDQKMDALGRSGPMGVVKRNLALHDRDLLQLDRAMNPGRGSDEAVANPAAYARRQVGIVEGACTSIGKGCAAAMSEDAYNPDRLLHAIGNL